MSSSHSGSGTEDKGSHETVLAHASSPRRLVIVTAIMLSIAALTFAPSLFSRDVAEVFIPVWLTLTIGVVIISMWFTRYIMTAEKYRDSEPVPQAPAHSH